MTMANCIQCAIGDDDFSGDETPHDCAMVAERDARLIRVLDADVPRMSTDDLIRIANCETGLSARHPALRAAAAEISRRVELQNDSRATRKAVEYMAMRGLL